MGCHCLLQRIFLTQGSNLGLPHCRQTLYHLSHQGSPNNLNVGGFDMVPEVSESILSSFHSFYFILLFRTYFHHFVLHSLIRSASDILLLIPSRVFLISVIELFVYVCLFFNSSRSLLIDSCIFLHFVFKVFFFF